MILWVVGMLFLLSLILSKKVPKILLKWCKVCSDGSIETRFKFYRDGKYKELKMNARVRWDKKLDGGVWGMKFRWKNLYHLRWLILF